MRPTVIAVGLGPAGAEYLSSGAIDRIEGASTVRLRTHRHPAAERFADLESFDALYDAASDFDALYARIADELVALASADAHGTVVYAVPGSPLVAERTVAILRARDDVDLVVVPSISFIDLACAAMGIDPLDSGLRLADALSLPERLRGPGPVLIAQAHSPSVLSDIALRVDIDLADDVPTAVVLHHLGLHDESVVSMSLGELGGFDHPDHLTSVYLPALRTAGDATEDLVALMAELRARCPWDQVQTHASLARHLLEEAYETLDAIDGLVRALDAQTTGAATTATAAAVEAAGAHVAEELGDLLFQVVFHAHLGEEEGLFDLRAIADGVRTKLVGRHPHVFSDAIATTPDAVATRWEELKREEKGRDSVMDGIPVQLPSLSLMAKVRRKAMAAGVELEGRDALLAAARRAIDALPAREVADDATIGEDRAATAAIGALLESACDLARGLGVDAEQALRDRALALMASVRAMEQADGYRAGRATGGSVVATEARSDDEE